MTMIQTTAPDNRLTRRAPPDIDLVGPLEACEMLVVDEAQLLDLANGGELTAYRLGGHVRFRSADVLSLARSCL
ncbi:MAG: helix-turn-helix domain-containing protein [bacterium]|nr:helix-turn-helix domain-containing protein [bacterium]MCY3923911.1 helix-turn-helix domain-containing protein [bacterium]